MVFIQLSNTYFTLKMMMVDWRKTPRIKRMQQTIQMLRKVGVSADGSVSIEELKMVTRTRKRVMRRPRRPINHSAWVGMAKVTKEIRCRESCTPATIPTSSHVVATRTLVAIDHANCVCSTS